VLRKVCLIKESIGWPILSSIILEFNFDSFDLVLFKLYL